MLVVGRDFSEDILSRIRTRVLDEPTLTRTALSREVCGWMEWRGGDGRPKDMSCRVALLKLSRRGLIELPAAQDVSFARAALSARAVQPSWLRIEAPLAQLGRVWLVPVDGGQAELSRTWWAMMQAHHPLGAGPLCGAQMRYLIACEAGVLGGLSFSAPAWRLAARDAWVGWNDAARRKGLSKVVANSRYLILPSVQVPNLASHVLALALKRLSADWQDLYGIAPVLVETFVDCTRYRGTCYRAANWRHLGQTQGRGRQDRAHAARGTSKDIWVYPLHPRWQSILQGAEGPAPAANTRPPSAVPLDWAEQEFGGCALPDARLRTRLLTLARDFYARPTASLTQACSSRAKTKAAYRFLDHEHTTMDTLLQPHYRSTQARMRGERVVLAVQDTSSLNYTAHAATQGLGPIGTTANGAQGLQLHSTLAFNVQGTPLGFIDVQCWAREPDEFGKKAQRDRVPIEAKESYKWLKSLHATAAAQASCPHTTLVSVGDRESDLYELFAEAAAHPEGPKLLVRAKHNRKLQDEQQRLWETMQARSADAVQVLQVPRQGSRAARAARMDIRYAAVTLVAPTGHKGPAIAVWAVLAQEQDAPAGVKPLEWMLLTTVEVNSARQACERLMWYSRRWGIEVLHRTLKSGCRIEQRQLGQADRLEACLAIDLVVAWRIYHLCKLGRDDPQAPCTVYFEAAEWKALTVFMTKKTAAPNQVPTLRDMIHRVATLGGFLGRKGDGEPGTQTLWLGLQRLDDIVAMWLAMTESIAATQTPVSSKGGSG
jgi:Domain of unknown function (DUF4338)/Transposase Tn5 dimerisation domain/Transposase DNA-binding